MQVIGFVSFHPPVNQPGTEGEQRGDKDESGAAERPLGDAGGVEQRGAKNHEENAVGQADEAHGLGLAPDVFQRHGQKEEDEKRSAFDQGKGAEKSDWVCHFWLSDNIVLLSTEVKEKVKRTVSVIKARGGAHDLNIHEIEITGNGVRVI